MSWGAVRLWRMVWCGVWHGICGVVHHLVALDVGGKGEEDVAFGLAGGHDVDRAWMQVGIEGLNGLLVHASRLIGQACKGNRICAGAVQDQPFKF